MAIWFEFGSDCGDEWFDAQLDEHHPLGAGRSVGDHLRQIVEIDGRPVALLVWGPACYALKDRDLWIGWSASQRVERLKLIVQNRRFLLLHQKGQFPNRASQAMGTSNWEPVGFSAGYSRHRADFYVPNERPKRLWMRELAPGARPQLRGVHLPEHCRPALLQACSGVLPIAQEQMDSLLEVFRKAPDPRDTNTQYRIGPVLTLIAMALLAGRREIAEIARFAKSLTPLQRRRLGLPRKKGTRAFYKVPGYDVFYQMLTRMDPEAFAQLLSQWLTSRAGSLPQALALDGKMIRDHIGILTLAQHDDGAPQAMAVYDQKEGTERCELSAADALLNQLPTLDGANYGAIRTAARSESVRCYDPKRTPFRLKADSGPTETVQF